LQERQLLHALNACLKLLQDTKWFEKYWQENGDGKRLMEILKSTSPARPQAAKTSVKPPRKTAKKGTT
jgi:hypothetical protein